MAKKHKIYSHSKISTFEQCPLKYKFKYIDKIEMLGKSIESLLGFCVHSVLEYLYDEVKSKRIPAIEEIIKVYSETWEENFHENIIIVKQEFNESDYFNKGVQFLVSYYTKNFPFDDNTLETEKRIEIILDENEAECISIIGYIDRLAHNTEKNEIEIHDYKTANSLPAKEKIENDRQLALYSIAIKKEFGNDKKICLIWHYLAHNIKICSYRTDEQLENLKREILESINEIESASEFPSNKSILCGWCEYKGVCPEFKVKEKQEKLF